VLAAGPVKSQATPKALSRRDIYPRPPLHGALAPTRPLTHPQVFKRLVWSAHKAPKFLPRRNWQESCRWGTVAAEISTQPNRRGTGPRRSGNPLGPMWFLGRVAGAPA